MEGEEGVADGWMRKMKYVSSTFQHCRNHSFMPILFLCASFVITPSVVFILFLIFSFFEEFWRKWKRLYFFCSWRQILSLNLVCVFVCWSGRVVVWALVRSSTWNIFLSSWLSSSPDIFSCSVSNYSISCVFASPFCSIFCSPSLFSSASVESEENSESFCSFCHLPTFLSFWCFSLFVNHVIALIWLDASTLLIITSASGGYLTASI